MSSLNPAFFKPFVDGTRDTLQVQCKLTLQADKPFIKGNSPQSVGEIAAIIGITSKTFNGNISLVFPEKTFLKIMSNMLGENYTAITKDLEDGAAELLNIIFGRAKIVLNEQGHAIEKAIPSVIRGANITVSTKSPEPVIVLPFSIPEGNFYIEICVAPTL